MTKLNFEDVKSMLDDVMHDMDEKINVLWITTDGTTTQLQLNGDSMVMLSAIVSSQNEEFRALIKSTAKYMEMINK